MRRRDFLKRGTAAAAGLAASKELLDPLAKASETAKLNPIPKRRLGRTGADLSIIALGGIVVMDTEQPFANNIVAEAFDRGINYFDVAPEYGNAQQKLGPALEPYRKRSFLACKTLMRDKGGAAGDLEDSLRKLRTDHVDLYQFHAVTTKEDVEKIFGPNGAMETFQAARKAGKVRFIGFSAHSVENAFSMLDHYDFDTILFPINFVLFSQANFGPQVLAQCARKRYGYPGAEIHGKDHMAGSGEEEPPRTPSAGISPPPCRKRPHWACAGLCRIPSPPRCLPAMRNISGSPWTWHRNSSPSSRKKRKPSWRAPKESSRFSTWRRRDETKSLSGPLPGGWADGRNG